MVHFVVMRRLRGTGILSREISVKIVLAPSEKGSTLKGKNLLPKGASSVLIDLIPFENAHEMQESKQEVTKIISLEKSQKIYQMYPDPMHVIVQSEECFCNRRTGRSGYPQTHAFHVTEALSIAK